MGKVGRDIREKLSNHLKSVSKVHQEMIERLQTVRTFTPGYPIKDFGKFIIIPIIVDHSAFDAYAFKIKVDGTSVFHTGDFRTHGFRSGVLPDVIKKFIGEVDYVVCEATNISRPTATSLSEHDLQKEFIELFKNEKNKNHVVCVSSTNIDRLFGLYHAAIKANRVFIIDEYQKEVMDVVTERDSIWGKSKLYQFLKNHPPMVLSISKGDFWMNDKFRKLIEDKGFVLIARSQPRFDKFIANIHGEKQTYLSMWDGYVKEGSETYNECLAKSLGPNYLHKHTSGHCDMNSLRDFFHLLNPKAIIPIHTDKPEEFAQLFSDEWSVLLLNDGDGISVS